MAEHVDLVKNEWLAGMQIRLATVLRSNGDVALANVTPGWEDLLSRPLPNGDGDVFYLMKEPDKALGFLSQFFTSEYVFATEVHDENDCPFRHGGVLAMKQVPGRP
jgi:hypothetical protein